MDQTKIYIKGKKGFKAAVKTKLGGTWIHGGSDINVDTVMFSLAADSQLTDFKSSIGEELISEYNLKFLNDLEEQDDAELSKPDSKKPVLMSIWTNKDSNINVRKVQKPQHDPSPGIVL